MRTQLENDFGVLQKKSLSWITMPDPFPPPLSLRNEFIFLLELLTAFCVDCGSDPVAEFRREIVMTTENQKDGGKTVLNKKPSLGGAFLWLFCGML